MRKRNYVLSIIKEIFEIYGFEPLETPSLELWDTLSGKYGDEADRLTYRFTDRGNREVGLRYDLTVPLSRLIAMYPQIPKPFKRYQIQPVWRADKPQKGRFREFYQCDVDIVGSPSLLADAEIIAITNDILKKLNFNKYKIRINSRKILSGIREVSGAAPEEEILICRAIDKIDKIGIAGVKEQLSDYKIPSNSVKSIMEIIQFGGTNEDQLSRLEELFTPSEIGREGLQEISTLLSYLSEYKISEDILFFDLYLARGLDYYTGPIYETIVEEPKIGSITGGGRYDNLIGLFSGNDQPATGTTIGLERIITVMDELHLFPANLSTDVQVLVTVFDQSTLPFSIQIANKLRMAGIKTDLYSGKSKLRGQFGLANDKKIPIVIIAGPDEKEINEVNVKQMKSGNQFRVSLDDLIKKIQSLVIQEE
jgi:histidyl-tRNA synthetase